MALPPQFFRQPELPWRQVAAVSDAWKVTYIKGAEQLLLKTITTMNTERKRAPYDNFMTIVQSSGTGKSRMVHELGKYVFTIPLNIRPEVESENAAYPAPDGALRNHLFQESNCTTQKMLQTRFSAFFEHLFGCIIKELQTEEFIDRLARASTDRPPSETVARAWFEHLQARDGEDTNRTKLYKKVVRCCKSSSFRTEDTGETMKVVGTSKTEGKKRQISGSLPSPMAPKDPVENRNEKKETRLAVFSTSAEQKLDDLIRHIEVLADQISRKTSYKETQDVSETVRPPRVVMYIDEAHIMAHMCVADMFWRSYYNEFISACNSFTSSDIFFLYLSTNAIINESTLPLDHADATVSIQPPFTELPFDCLAGHQGFKLLSISNTLTDRSKTLNQVSDLRFLSQFGRPLFGTFLNALIDPGENTVDNGPSLVVVRLARAKLLCRADPEDINEYESATSYLTLFGVRILLQYSMEREHGRKTILKLIERHMAIAFSVPQHRETIAMGYPSEPILAEAAAQHFHYLRNTDIRNLFGVLLNLINNGFANKGERGELVARLLFILAYDDAIINHQKGARILKFSKGVPMEDFIRALFTHEHAEEILKSVPDNIVDGETFREAFKDVWIRFTHFGLAEGADFVDATSMCLAFVRCMSIQCSSQKRGINIAIPGLHRYPKNESGQAKEQHLCEKHMTGMYCSTNNRKHALRDSETVTAESLGLFPEGSSGRAYVAFIMNLGVEEDNLDIKVGTPPPPSESQRTHESGVHPRYTIHAYGCRNELYKVVSREDEYFFKSLLEPPNMLDDHARQSDESLYAVKKLKPYWKKDAARCDWATGWE